MKKRIAFLASIFIFASCSLEDKKMSWVVPMMEESSMLDTSYRAFQYDEEQKKIYSDGYYAFDQAEIMFYNYLFESQKDELQEKITECKKYILHLSMCFDRHTFFENEKGEILHNVAYLNSKIGHENQIFLEKETYDLLKIAYRLTIDTKGKFHCGIGVLSSLWDDYIERNSREKDIQNPSEEEVNQALSSIPSIEEMKQIFQFHDESNMVEIHYESINPFQITFGGIGKGRTTDLLSSFLKDKSTMISMGQSSLSSYGDSFFDTWNISIHNPGNIYNNNDVLRFEKQGSFSFSTSGDYQNYYLSEDQVRFHHIIDPFTGYPSGINPETRKENDNVTRSVTVYYPDEENAGAICDALSTALMCSSGEEREEILNTFSAARAFYINENKEGITCYVDQRMENFVELPSESTMNLSFF